MLRTRPTRSVSDCPSQTGCRARHPPVLTRPCSAVLQTEVAAMRDNWEKALRALRAEVDENLNGKVAVAVAGERPATDPACPRAPCSLLTAAFCLLLSPQQQPLKTDDLRDRIAALEAAMPTKASAEDLAKLDEAVTALAAVVANKASGEVRSGPQQRSSQSRPRLLTPVPPSPFPSPRPQQDMDKAQKDIADILEQLKYLKGSEFAVAVKNVILPDLLDRLSNEGKGGDITLFESRL